jgi:hypothetical protein
LTNYVNTHREARQHSLLSRRGCPGIRSSGGIPCTSSTYSIRRLPPYLEMETDREGQEEEGEATRGREVEEAKGETGGRGYHGDDCNHPS